MRKIGYILKVSNGYDWQYCNDEAGACITINFNTQEVKKVNFYKGRVSLTIREVEAVAKEIKRRRTEYNEYVSEYNITPGR